MLLHFSMELLQVSIALNIILQSESPAAQHSGDMLHSTHNNRPAMTSPFYWRQFWHPGLGAGWVQVSSPGFLFLAMPLQALFFNTFIPVSRSVNKLKANKPLLSSSQDVFRTAPRHTAHPLHVRLLLWETSDCLCVESYANRLSPASQDLFVYFFEMCFVSVKAWQRWMIFISQLELYPPLLQTLSSAVALVLHFHMWMRGYVYLYFKII